MRNRLLLALLIAASVLAGCGDDDPSPEAVNTTVSTFPFTFPPGTAMDVLQKKGKIAIGTTFDQPLFGLKGQSAEPEGFDVEIAKLVTKTIFGENLSGRTEFVEAPSAIREQLIIDGKVDIVAATYTINDARKQKVSFAGPYYISEQSILVKKADNAITGPSTLTGKKVCTVTGSTPLEVLQARAPGADLSILFDTYSKCVEALKDGRIEAVSADNVILRSFITDNPDQFKLTAETFPQEPYGVGLKKEDIIFRAFINNVIETAYRDGTWAKIFEAQIGKPTSIPAPTPPPIDRYRAT